jgi:uncharacterized membrane protein
MTSLFGTAAACVVLAVWGIFTLDESYGVYPVIGGALYLISLGDVHGTPLAEMPLEDFERPIRTAARTQFSTSRAAAPT